MGSKPRVKPITEGEVKELLKPGPYGGREYLSSQLRKVFVPVESSVVLN